MTQTAGRRSWLITGASSGVGRELAVTVMERGERVAAIARSAGDLSQLAAGFPDQLLALPADVRDESAVRHAVARATDVFGRIDVVVNAAGYALLGPVEEISDEQARANFDTNLFGVMNVMRAVLPVLREQRAGHVVQISSIFGHMTYPGTGILAATKHAVGAVTEALALELASIGITFSLMEPGAVDTPFLSKADVVRAGTRYPAVDEVIAGLLNIPFELKLPPRAMAEAIIETADSPRPPLRVALGPGSEELIRQTLHERLWAMDSVPRGGDDSTRTSRS